MNRASLVRLAQGLAVQLACYAGLFLALAVAARALSPSEFGTYASAVAVASFAGSVITLGLDRILLRVLIQRGDGSGQAKAALSQSVFVPAVTLNIAILVGVIGLTAIGWVATNQLLIAVMAVMVAGRLILSGWFKFMSNNHANVIATFGLHSLGIGLTFGLIMVINPRSAFITHPSGQPTMSPAFTPWRALPRRSSPWPDRM